MNRLIAAVALLTLATTASAQKLELTTFNDPVKTIEIVQRDGYMPIRVDSRVYFYAHVTYDTDLQGIPQGTEAIILWGVQCPTAQQKKPLERFVVTELKLPDAQPKKMQPHDEAIAVEMQGKPFKEPTSSLHEALLDHICKEVK